MKTLIVTLFSLLYSSNILALHPTHLSVVNLNYNADSMEMTYSIRLFQDDLNYLISALYHNELYHTADTFDLNSNTHKLDNYFLSTFEVFAGDIPCESTITGRKSDEHEYWIFFRTELTEWPEMIKIRNRILLDIYSDQTNLVIVSDGINEKGYSFDLKKQEQNINLDGK